MPRMLPPLFEPFNTLATTFSQAVLDRMTLFLNHVLSSEPAATARLVPHAGRSLALVWRQWPPFLPPPPALAWQVTPAGLLERVTLPAEQATLLVSLDAGDLPRWWAAVQAGGTPPMDVQGDAAFAADVNWLIANVRWDVEDDLARVIGDAPAREIVRWGRSLSAALRGFAGGPGAGR
jgi:ubiquinone biosynthesis protein UbiJ